MKLIPCPLNGPRNINEFAYGGEVTDMPAAGADDAAWTDHIFLRDNAAGVVREWWFHVPSAYWFIVERDTVSDSVIRSYPADRLYATRVDFAPERG